MALQRQLNITTSQNKFAVLTHLRLITSTWANIWHLAQHSHYLFNRSLPTEDLCSLTFFSLDGW